MTRNFDLDELWVLQKMVSEKLQDIYKRYADSEPGAIYKDHDYRRYNVIKQILDANIETRKKIRDKKSGML